MNDIDVYVPLEVAAALWNAHHSRYRLREAAPGEASHRSISDVGTTEVKTKIEVGVNRLVDLLPKRMTRIAPTEGRHQGKREMARRRKHLAKTSNTPRSER